MSTRRRYAIRFKGYWVAGLFTVMRLGAIMRSSGAAMVGGSGTGRMVDT